MGKLGEKGSLSEAFSVGHQCSWQGFCNIEVRCAASARCQQGPRCTVRASARCGPTQEAGTSGAQGQLELKGGFSQVLVRLKAVVLNESE